MVPVQDALMTLPHNRYGQYLQHVYRKMAAHVPLTADVIEVGVRPEDRGVLSRLIVPHHRFTCVDRDQERAHAAANVRFHTNSPRADPLVVDVLDTPIEADVIISTCILHHTPEKHIRRLLHNLCAPILLLSGPNASVMTELFGDHEWHIDIGKLIMWLNEVGYTDVTWESIGLSEPLCEVLVVAKGWGRWNTPSLS